MNLSRAALRFLAKTSPEACIHLPDLQSDGCNFRPRGALYFIMRFFSSPLKPLPLPLRWLLALALILNGAVVPPIMAHAAMNDGHDVTAQAASTHCHKHDASISSDSAKHHQNKCPCCDAGNACQCGCVVVLALPMTFPDLRPLAPLIITERLALPELVAAPRHRLLRPPIV